MKYGCMFKKRTTSILFYFRDLLSKNDTNLEKLIELEKEVQDNSEKATSRSQDAVMNESPLTEQIKDCKSSSRELNAKLKSISS